MLWSAEANTVHPTLGWHLLRPITSDEQAQLRADFEAMITDEFWEIGASGRRYPREFVLEVLYERYCTDKEYVDEWQADGFEVRRLAPDVFLLTYTLLQGKRATRRATIWENSTGRWRATFHQGTVIQDKE